VRRRTLLGGLGALGTTGLAGCVGFPAPSWSDDAGPATTVSLDEQDAVPEQYGIDIAVEVVRAEFTDESPAAILGTTTNRGGPVKLSIGTGYCSIFNRQRGGSDEPPGLWLHRPDSHGIERADGRWVTDLPRDEPRGFPDVGCTMEAYREGQAVSTPYQVWDDYQTSGHLVPGTYRWEESVTVSDASSDSGSGEESFTWGFSLRLEA
jgi:hypothetical protein